MKISIKSIGKKTVAAIVAAVAVGSIATIAVFAAIPSAQGVINSCYSNFNGNARIIDSAANCGFNQTNLKWDRGMVAYAHLQWDEASSVFTLVNADSYNIDALLSPVLGGTFACLKVNSSVAGSIRLTALSADPTVPSVSAAINGKSVIEDDFISTNCPANTNVAISVTGSVDGSNVYVSIF